MEAKELRIGNYLKTDRECQDDYVEVVEIYNENYFCTCSAGLNYQKEHVKPIPLTEEWLERFGCDLIVFDITKGDVGFDFWLVPKWSDYSISVNLEHVHQLQNLYFALTQEELKCS